MSVFSDYLNLLITDKDMTLRELSRLTKIDVGNLSRLERGVVNPPRKKATLKKISTALKLSEEEEKKLYETADLSNGQIPDGLDNVKNNEAIPMLLRAINNRNLTREEVESLSRKINEELSWQGGFID